MRLIVISDLHIIDEHDPVFRRLILFFQNRVQPLDTLVLAGDIFDLFVGNKEIFKNRFAEFFDELKRLGLMGCQLYYIEGNHDFLLRNAFQGISNLHLIEDEFDLNLGDKRFWLAHGDLVNQKDYKYRMLRASFRSLLMKGFISALPDKAADQLGRTLSERSRKYSPRLATHLNHKKRDELRKIYRSFAAEKLAEGYDFVVMGHCHDLDEMNFQIDGRSGQYINVGYPREHGFFLEWSAGKSKIERKEF